MPISSIPAYNFQEIEAKWQKFWLDNNAFRSRQEAGRKKVYVLDMFPYPSGDGLHVGHVKIYTASDIVARYLRMKGFNVLHPTGWDAFGLPTENSALKYGVHPRELTARNIERFRGQMQRLGFSYDWEREVNTTDPQYYKWTQWIFLKLFRMGLAYEATVPINWCPSCQTGLANEEVVDGKCERCGAIVEQKPMRQWMLKITRYADYLLKDLSGLQWPPFIKELQENWIGRSEGVRVVFELDRPAGAAPQAAARRKLELPVFTTRADTLNGATYVVIAPEHPLAEEAVAPEQRAVVDEYLKNIRQKTNLERTDLNKEKTGVFTGSYAVNPLNGERLPVWMADYVLMSYGTGAIMAVPAHDDRDFAFAKKYNLPIKQVIEPKDAHESVTLPFTGEGILINVGRYDGLESGEARQRIADELQAKGKARGAVNYRLRDWVFSRQRYWGEPIPVVHCEKCGTVPVPEDQLPVLLPEVEKFAPTGTGESPLASLTDWVDVACPTCPGRAKRETNTMPQWAGSSWYFLRFADPHNDAEPASREALQYWLPVDLYIGGAEHAVLHLLYARFWTKVLADAGAVPFKEPFMRLRNVGLIMGEDGQKMSKSRGNVVNPDEVVKKYGADTLRVYEMFLGPFDAAAAWNTSSIAGADRFIRRAWEAVLMAASGQGQAADKALKAEEMEIKLQQTIKRVSEGTEQFKFNTAVSALMEFLNELERQPNVRRDILERFVLLLSPYAPHVAEELWQRLGHESLAMNAEWPKWDERIINQADLTVPVQVDSRVRGTLNVPAGSTQKYVEEKARALPNVNKYLEGKAIGKTIFVPDKMINFVTKK